MCDGEGGFTEILSNFLVMTFVNDTGVSLSLSVQMVHHFVIRGVSCQVGSIGYTTF
jgi:hypothetical protein